MEAEKDQPGQGQPSLQPQTPEKVIQPLDPSLTASHAAPRVPPLVAAPHDDGQTATSSYDPAADTAYKTPTLDLRKPLDEHTPKTIAMQHKSLMVLAIVGLLGTLFTVFSAVQVNHAIQQAQLKNASDIGSAQITLDIIYATIVVSIMINVYFLLAKDRHMVGTVLKILLVLELISVFGIFWGVSPTKGIDLLVNGAYLMFIYIVLNIVRTGSTI